MTLRIGFIGQGWIGRHYADDFERRGYEVVRYGLEKRYRANKRRIPECDIVFIAVPTPTNGTGFDSSIVRAVLPLVGIGKTAVVKSTLLPGTTEALQKEFPDRIILHSPEFLREASAAHDAANPARNLIGMPKKSKKHRAAAEQVLAILPPAPFTAIMSARSAEFVKYAGNFFLALKVVYANLLYDLATSLALPHPEVSEAIAADPRIGASHLSVFSASGHAKKRGRGAGGHCLIKDLEAFRLIYEEKTGDEKGSALLAALVRKNNALLTASRKDLDLLRAVYPEGHDLLR